MKRKIPRHTSRLRHPALLAWLRLARVFHKVDNASAQHFRQHDLSTAQFDVLAQVGAAEGLSQQELAGSLLVTKGNISQILKRMEQQGIIRRCQEGRANCLFLTERGREMFDRIVPSQEALITELFQTLSSEEQRQLLDLLRLLDQSLK